MNPQEKHTDLINKLSSRKWRLENLYYIKDELGNKVLFKPNWAQQDFYGNIWYFNVILKARQLGFSTFILIYILDAILFNSSKEAGVIAHSLEDAKKLFQNKVKYAYDNLPPEIKAMVSATQDSAASLKFSNGSGISVGTSLRGGTLQYLHVSEYGKIAAKYPDKAKEIKTGALNTVHVGSQIFIESTAEGQGGEFYELTQRAQQLQDLGKELSPLDPKFHFYPWWQHKGYVLPQEQAVVSKDLNIYFDQIETEQNTIITPEQRAWYSKKAEAMGDDMKREFPSTPKESFETSVEGSYYNKEMALLRKEGHIVSVPWSAKVPVHTFWDLGIDDYMTITFMQHVGKEYHIIDYYENSGEGIQHYADYLQKLPYTYGEHYWPHDGDIRELGTGAERWKTANTMGIKPIRIVERAKSVGNDIQKVRNFLPECWFDDKKCDKLIKHLTNYRKEWNDRTGMWRDSPLHNDASHGADSFRTLAVGYREIIKKPKEPKVPVKWENW